MRKPVINPGIINRLKMLFAIVQDGDTATRNIAKGKCVIWKNTPCRAITDISTGDTLSSVNLSTDAEGYINSVENNISNLQDGIAIVANNNTHPSVSLGQFVYVKNHDTLAEGLYKASSNIAVTDPLSTSNLVADDSGGLNALKSDVDTLSSKIAEKDNKGVTWVFSSKFPRNVVYDASAFWDDASEIILLIGNNSVQENISYMEIHYYKQYQTMVLITGYGLGGQNTFTQVGFDDMAKTIKIKDCRINGIQIDPYCKLYYK